MGSLFSSLSRYTRRYQSVRSDSSANVSAGRTRKRIQLYLERLEDRFVPSSLLAINNDNGSTGTSGFTQSDTSLVALGNTVVVGFNDSGSYNISHGKLTGFAYSSDGGNTFTDGGQLPSSSKTGDGGSPVLAQNTSSGRIYFATVQFNGSGINVFSSDNDGATWQAPVAGTPGGNGIDPWMTVDNFSGSAQGNVYLVVQNGGIVSTGIYLYKSTNNGGTFGPSGGTLIASAGSSGNIQGAFVTVGPDHAVYVFYLDESSATEYLRVVKSTTQGASFGAPVTVATLKTTGFNGDLGLSGIVNGATASAGFRSNAFPRAAVNPVNGQLYVTYNDVGTKPGDKADIYFTMSSDGGNTWSTAVRVNSDNTTTDQWQPTIAASTDGRRVGIFYYSRQEDPTGDNLFKYYGTLGAVSSPVGATSTVTFGTSFAVSNTASPPEFGRDSIVNDIYMGDYDQTVATSGYFNVSWSDSHDPLPNGSPRMDPNVYFQKIPNGLAVGSSLPAAGAVVSTLAHPTQYVINFLDPVNTLINNPGVFTVNGQVATGVTMSNNNQTATFTFMTDPIDGVGSQTMAIAAGAVTRQGDNNPIQAWNATFTVSPLTIGTAMPAMTATPRTFSYVVNFSGPINPATISVSNLKLSAGVVLSAAPTQTNPQQVTYTLGLLPPSGTLTVSMPANAVTDTSGNPNVGFSASYTLDLGTFAGGLDPTFGNGGKVLSPFQSADGFVPLVVQSDGKIVMGEQITTAGGTQNFALVRYNTNGSLDINFGSGGIVSTPVGKGNAIINGLALQGDGKIVAVGQAVYAVNGSTNDTAFAVARYNTNGTLDPNFGSGGIVLTNIVTATTKGNIKPGDDKAISVAIDSSGRIIAAGYSEQGNSSETEDFALVRYNSNGALDTTFGSGGIVVTPNFGSGQDVGQALLIQSDGKIVLAGYNHANATTDVMAVARYLPTSGVLDSSFGTSGIVTLAPAGSTSTSAVGAVLQNGGIVLSGNSTYAGLSDLTLARLTTLGQLDTTFGGAGTGFAISTNMALGRTIVQAANGELYTSGREDPTEPLSSGTLDLGVAAYLPNGTLDTTFGTNGVTAFDFGGTDDRGREIALQSDGKILVTGFTRPYGSSTETFVLLRLLPSYAQIVPGSFTASQSSPGANTTLTAIVADGNPGVTTPMQVAFYLETSGNGILEPGTDTILGSGNATPNGDGTWTYSITTTLLPGTYTLYVQAQDNYGVFSDPVSISFTVM
jgi:uncharacterized delta-60 repeat protein